MPRLLALQAWRVSPGRLLMRAASLRKVVSTAFDFPAF
jgi:hypothetical protein